MILTAIACILFLSINIYIQTQSFINIFAIIIIAFIGSFMAYFYTAEPLRLSARRGLGEFTIFLTFGPLLTLGSFFAMSSTSVDINFNTLKNFLILGIPLGLLTTNILLINQFPDLNSDKNSNKLNLVVLFGKKLSRWIYLFNLLLIYSITFYFFKNFSQTFTSVKYNILVIIFSGIIFYGLYIFRGLFRHYDSRDLIYYNIHTIYYQIIFCLGIILAFYL